MKIILRDDVEKVGLAGETKEVSDGFARNFLLPKNLAMPATDSSLRKWQSEKKVREVRLTRDLEKAKALAADLEKVSLRISAKSGREGHLFGSITSQAIADALLQKGFSVDKKNILLESPIKAVGEFEVPIRLHSQAQVTLKVTVAGEGAAEPVSAS